jgi:two-component system sensor histidine kinase YesM
MLNNQSLDEKRLGDQRVPAAALPGDEGAFSRPRRLDTLVGYFSSINLSIRTKILLATLCVIFVLSAIAALVIFQGIQFNRAYDKIINNITTANSINGYIKPAVDTATWAVVAGKSQFSDGEQYAIVEEVRQQIHSMIDNTDSHRARVKLDVILRTLATLESYIDQMGLQIASHATVAENEAQLEKVWWITGLINELVQDYILFEVNRAEQNYRATQGSFNSWVIVYVVVLVGALLFSVAAAWLISEGVYVPIKKLHNVTKTIAQQDLEVLVNTRNANEIAELGNSFNIMIGKIGELLDSKMTEHENLMKAEFRALQAQINPHFLYNTLDTIVWMAEARQNEQVIELVRALSSFFRISLSKGKDWITLRDELEHTRSYLTIQKIRYRDILDFSIDVDESLLNATILKFMLQPLVENALYHGIKNRRNGGEIRVRVRPFGLDRMLVQVEDDGIGITVAHLNQIRASLNEDVDALLFADADVPVPPRSIVPSAGFGLANVNKRIKLYYGKQYSVQVESAYQVGTTVSMIVPRIATADSVESPVVEAATQLATESVQITQPA